MVVVSIVKILIKEINMMQEQKGSRGMEILRKKKEILQIKSTTTEMKKAYGLISRLDIVKNKHDHATISVLKNVNQTFYTKKYRGEVIKSIYELHDNARSNRKTFYLLILDV